MLSKSRLHKTFSSFLWVSFPFDFRLERLEVKKVIMIPRFIMALKRADGERRYQDVLSSDSFRGNRCQSPMSMPIQYYYIVLCTMNVKCES